MVTLSKKALWVLFDAHFRPERAAQTMDVLKGCCGLVLKKIIQVLLSSLLW